MTYCIGIKLDAGLVFLSDSRTSAGLDHISTYRKVMLYEQPGERFMVLQSAGNLSIAQSVREMLQRYKDNGIRHLVALRGDLPSGLAAPGEFRYANELVAFIRKEFGDHFVIEVAAYPEYHPQARTPQEDLLNFRRKVEAGANSAITQYFYNPASYYHFVDQCQAMGLRIPIVPGIMPIGRFSQLARFSDACGAEIPRWIRKKLEGYGDDSASIRAFGLDVVTALCDELLRNGAPGLHFYTLNQASLTITIWQRLKL